MLAHVVRTAQDAANVAQVCVLGPSRHGLPESLCLLADPGGGLNAALHAGLAAAQAGGATRLLVLPADLPQLSRQDVELLAAAPAGSMAIAPDRHGTGTNALSLPLPAASAFRFAFGADSFAAHHDEALRLGLTIETIHSQTLARDIDCPEDLPDADHLSA